MKISYSLITFTLIAFIFFSAHTSDHHKKRANSSLKEEDEMKEEDNDWFVNQRSFPYGNVDYNAYKNAVESVRMSRANMRSANVSHAWQLAGPVNIGGRITDVEMHASDLQTMYLGAASGGVFKSINAGASWFPIFDEQPSLSIGDIAIAPSDANLIYVGTGEANGGGGSLTYDGMGIFKSTDAGATWNSVGLDSTRGTGRIAINPLNPQIVYAATMGDLFGDNPQRGIYKTINGGTSWQKMLSPNDSTGAIDIVINPANPDTVYACLWTRVRRPGRRNYGGPASGVYRSYNGGTTWTKLTNGFPTVDLGRIGIDISQSSPNILYATVTNAIGVNVGIFKSTDYGTTWNTITSNFSASSYSYWYGRIKIDPTDANIAYEIDFDCWKTTDGGSSWNDISQAVHVDHHAVYVHPLNNNLVLLGNDGGMHISTDGGTNWTHDVTLPITQFYTCELDESYPAALAGGAQDNGVNITNTGSFNDWSEYVYGDGFATLIDPTDNTYIYGASQYGNLYGSTDGGFSYNSIFFGSIAPRINWNTPVVFNPMNTATLYVGADQLYKTTDRGITWNTISPDLTNGVGPMSYPIVYGTITSIAVAPSDTNVIYVGTDDGNIQITTDGGSTWNLISSSLPLRWITRIAVDPNDAMSAYVTLSGYRYNDNMSHVYHTTNGGVSWIDIGGNLPDVPVNEIIFDSTLNALYLGTDVGVFYSYTGTNFWQVLGDSLPAVPITDLRLHEPTRTLLAATYGRSMYKYDLNTLTVNVNSVATINHTRMGCTPNPFHDRLNLNLYCDQNNFAAIDLYNISGKKVATIFNGELTKGNHSINYPVSKINSSLAGGIYFVRYTSAAESVLVKVLFLP